ncbi:MAG: ATP-binding protein [Polyangiaceae bacterium]|nr:ATP-binding protein [Polyangiaceae bacterium]
MTSNIKLSLWGQYLGDATLAAAVLDRVVMRAIRIDIDGPSFRQHTARERAKQKGSAPPEDSLES